MSLSPTPGTYILCKRQSFYTEQKYPLCSTPVASTVSSTHTMSHTSLISPFRKIRSISLVIFFFGGGGGSSQFLWRRLINYCSSFFTLSFLFQSFAVYVAHRFFSPPPFVFNSTTFRKWRCCSIRTKWPLPQSSQARWIGVFWRLVSSPIEHCDAFSFDVSKARIHLSKKLSYKHLPTYIESFIYPTDAQLDGSKNVKIYITIYMRGAATCFGFSQPSSGSYYMCFAKVISINNYYIQPKISIDEISLLWLFCGCWTRIWY